LPLDWIKFCLKRTLLRQEKEKRPSDVELKSLLSDQHFLNVIKQIVFSCLSIVYDHGGFVTLEEIALSRGPSLVAGVFSGSLHWSLATDWLMTESPDLYNWVILPAFRSAVKLGLDQVTPPKNVFLCFLPIIRQIQIERNSYKYKIYTF